MLHSLPKRTSSNYKAWRKRVILLSIMLSLAVAVGIGIILSQSPKP